MKTPIEVSGQPAQFDGTKVRYRLAGWLAPLPRHSKQDAETAKLIPAVTVCAWHDADKSLTRRIEAAGYVTSHGICEECSKKILKQ